MIDEKPDIVVNLGDTLDFNSLSSYDKGKRSFVGRSYRADIENHLDFQERVWAPVKARKKKMPETYFLVGNHEQRVERVLDLSPELVGTVGLPSLRLDDYYDVVVPYNGGTPGVIEVEGILFAHFFITGISGRPIGGERPAHMLLNKTGASCVAGHSHLFDHAYQININGKVRTALINGTYNEAIPEWAGAIGRLWRPGLSILHDVEDGNYDLEWVSMSRMEKIYG